MPELIVLTALLAIGKNGIRFIRFLKFGFGGLSFGFKSG